MLYIAIYEEGIVMASESESRQELVARLAVS